MAKLLRYLKPIWWEVLIVMLLTALDAYLGLLLPDFMTKITAIMENPDYATGTDAMTGLIPLWGHNYITPTGDSVKDIWIVGGVMTGISFIALILSFFGSIMNSHVGAYFGQKLRQEVFHKVTGFSVADYGKFGTATLITRTTNDIEQCQQLVQMGLRILVRSPVTLIVAVIMILTKDARIAGVVAVSIPVIIVIMVVLFVLAYPLFEKFQTVFDKVTATLRESITGVRVVRAFNQQKSENKRFDDVNDEATKLVTKFSRIMSFANPTIGIVFDITYMAIFVVGYLLLDGRQFASQAEVMASFGNVIASAEYAMNIMFGFIMFSLLFIMVPRASASAKRINEVLAVTNQIKEPTAPIHPNNKEGVVEFQDVTFTFPDANVPTLNHISFKTKPGSTTAIIGSTGSGKSSVINLIPRFYDVTAGHVLIDGVDVRDYEKHELRDKIGFVPQQALLFSGTIRSNMEFGNPNASEEDIKLALDIAQATHFVSKKEQGLDSVVEHGGKNFSGGQKQRLCIARALVKKPEIYIFDDSFSALDFKTDIKLRTALKGYTKDSSVIIVAQRVSTILDADDIVVLSDGKIVGEGTHRQLLKSCQVYQEIVYSQLDKEEIAKTMKLAEAFSSEGGER
jgi:ATP-binding cassette subfamily B multidrug efflux pump